MSKKEEITTKDTGLSIVVPAGDIDDIVKSFEQYEDLKKKIVVESDIQRIGGEDFLKKSYWRKLATVFNLTTEVIDERREVIGSTMVYHFTYKATAPNGRSATGEGSCDIYEKAKKVGKDYLNPKTGEIASPNSIHNTRTTAATRAMNRSVSNLVGGGEVSAEEVEIVK